MQTRAPDLPPREIIELAEGLGMQSCEWTSLKGGRTNRAWRAKCSDDDVVFKVFDQARANPLFPNDPDAEATAMVTLRGTGLAPNFRYRMQFEDAECLVYDHQPGEALPGFDANAAKTLWNLHQIKVPDGLRRVSCTPDALIAEGKWFLRNADHPSVEMIANRQPCLINLSCGPDVFLHGDPVPSNFVRHGEALTLIDWQCPAVGDACFDLGLAMSPAMHLVYGSKAEDAPSMDVLSAYPDAETVSRYRMLAPFVHWRMAAYCAWKAGQGEAVYGDAISAELTALAS
ncbi:phosphotransferase [Celeribacter litoreus]|uniref:phosphotransferase n=1 Tax=Celeribacter litoreus TaxID=2876714 RepID=UPI001CCD8249|nr:phosphotransferase [Celeribacter litoreus]MCA0044252.1 phosphotransferase [Celeribacter litoreus]